MNKRNRLVAFLRFLVPGLGLALALFLIAQILLANWAENFGNLNIQLDRDQLVFNQPRYAGVTPQGLNYEIVADSARAALGNPDIIDLQGATLRSERNDGYSFVANAQDARWQFQGQTLLVPGVLSTSDSDGVVGKLNNSTIDWKTQILTAAGAVQFEFEDGSSINARSLVYNLKSREWDFSQVVYLVPGDGGINDEER